MSIYFIIAFIAYLLGSIPFGYILVRVFRGEDVRATGSGNIGATNVARKAPGLGIATLILDAAKGFAAVYMALAIAHSRLNHFFPGYIDSYDVSPIVLMSLAAVFAILGHVFPLWLKFKGGKGVATFLGILLAVAWPAALGFAAIWLAVAALTRYSSLSALVASAFSPALLWLLDQPGAAALFVILTVLIFITHRTNIARLLEGTEGKIGSAGKAHPSSS
jgi:acyl phosphate:glycerol-3-phosphate acyltransferase